MDSSLARGGARLSSPAAERGDGAVTIADAVHTLDALFRRRGVLGCADAADANDDGSVDVCDPVRTLVFLFRGAAVLPPPTAPTCGPDPTTDSLACDSAPACDGS